MNGSKEQPVHALSLRNLAREVGCAPSTLLKLYGSFGNLLQHVNLATLDRLRDAIAGQETPSPSERLKALARAYWGFAQRDPYRWQLLFDFPLAQEGELDQRQNAMIEGLFERVEGLWSSTPHTSSPSRPSAWRARCGVACMVWYSWA